MPRVSLWMIRAALLHLGLGFTFGALMLWNKGLPLGDGVARLLGPHIELVLIGWTLQLALGVAIWILPRFSGPRRHGRIELAWAACLLLNAGVVLAVAGLLGRVDGLLALGRALQALAAGAAALHLWPRVKPLGGQAASESR